MRIAIIGTGISGLASAWLLARRHDVQVFERDVRVGGHTHTHTVDRSWRGTPGPATVAVDTGFIVFNEATYPNLVRLFTELDVPTRDSDMSFAVRCERCDLEYAGSPAGIVAQPANLLKPSYQRMIADILRFNRLGNRLLDDPRIRDVSIGHFLPAMGFGHGFLNHYLYPMAAAVWSSGTDVIRDFPLHTLLHFFANHGLLGVTTHHQWKTVVGGSSSYIAPLTAGFDGRIHTGDGVVGVTRDGAGVDLRLASGATHRFDKVVIAAHADQALGMLTDASPDEKEVLGAWEYSRNATFLHTDTSFLPHREAARASWNYLLEDCRTPGERASLSYDMNRLQGIDTPERYVVTLNPSRPIASSELLAQLSYTHPGYTRESVASQPALAALSGRRHTFYAGAHHRYGFHEDGLLSAIIAADHLGVRW